MKKVILILALVLGFSLIIACNSTPEAVTDPEPTVEEVVDVLEDAAEAEEAAD